MFSKDRFLILVIPMKTMQLTKRKATYNICVYYIFVIYLSVYIQEFFFASIQSSSTLSIDATIQKNYRTSFYALRTLKLSSSFNGKQLFYVFPITLGCFIKLQRMRENGIYKSNGMSEGGTGFGTMLIKLLTTQLRGQLEQSTEQGTSSIIQFPLSMKVA